MLSCPNCHGYRFHVFFRELVCREYDARRLGDEWEKDTVIEVEPFVAVECASCGADLSKYGRMLIRVSEYLRHQD
jgi:hypothetical protein